MGTQLQIEIQAKIELCVLTEMAQAFGWSEKRTICIAHKMRYAGPNH